MFAIFFRAAITTLTMVTLVANATRAEEPLPDVDEVRRMLMPRCNNDVVCEKTGKPLKPDPLLVLGEKLFPAYEIIIADRKSDSAQVVNALICVRQVKADRTRFLSLALDRLTDSSQLVRCAAVELIGAIGSERDTTPVYAMLADEKRGVFRAAADALVEIGGKRDLVALDIWLKSDNHKGDPFRQNYVKECRDKLEKRLKETEKDKK